MKNGVFRRYTDLKTAARESFLSVFLDKKLHLIESNGALYLCKIPGYVKGTHSTELTLAFAMQRTGKKYLSDLLREAPAEQRASKKKALAWILQKYETNWTTLDFYSLGDVEDFLLKAGRINDERNQDALNGIIDKIMRAYGLDEDIVRLRL